MKGLVFGFSFVGFRFRVEGSDFSFRNGMIAMVGRAKLR